MNLSDLKLARLRAGLTQLELARETGVSESKICRLETGRQRASHDLAERIADVLNCTVDHLQLSLIGDKTEVQS
jgi:transcriptional regulator with XRE-family HTH domain